jgi:amino acid transporter
VSAKAGSKKGQMNLWSVSSMGIGAMVGAGIFALLGQVALVAGYETYVAFVFGGLVAMLSGYSYAKLAVRYPDAGGITVYFDHAFGARRLSGTLSLIYLLTIAVTVALVAKAFGAYAAPLFLGNSNRVWIDVFASGLVIAITSLNVVGSGLVGKAEVVLVGIKLLILAGLMIAGAISMVERPQVAHLHPGMLGIAGGVGLTFLAYAGFGMMANAAGNVADPKRTIPRAIYLAIAVVIVLYVGLSIVVVASVPPAQLAQHSNTAVAEAARPMLGQAGYIIVSVAALLATASGVNAWTFSAMKISLSLANAGQLPLLFSRVLWRNGTRGLMIGMACVLLIVNLFDLDALAHMASAIFLITYLAVHVAHWRLIHETKGSKPIVAVGFLSMAAVLADFFWSTLLTQPWSMGLIALFLAFSWAVEMILAPKGTTSNPAKNGSVNAAPAKAT